MRQFKASKWIFYNEFVRIWLKLMSWQILKQKWVYMTRPGNEYTIIIANNNNNNNNNNKTKQHFRYDMLMMMMLKSERTNRRHEEQMNWNMKIIYY